MKMNKSIAKPAAILTHEGGYATRGGDLSMQLYRATCAALLGEDTFYERGESVRDRIADLCTKAPLNDVLAIAAHAKNAMKLRHVPLWMCLSALAHPVAQHSPEFRSRIRKTLVDVIQRPDEFGEVLAMVWKDGKRPIPNTVRKALAQAFHKFNAYQFAKNDHNTAAIRLRDVMFLVHPKPNSPDEAQLFHDIASESLRTPDTWEVRISAAKSDVEKRAAWEVLLTENKLGALALLRNLRNMESVGVSRSLIIKALESMDTSKVLPFRFAAAYRNSTGFERVLDKAFQASCGVLPRLAGRTLVLVDHSGSMTAPLSAKSDLTRAIAAQSLAAVLIEVCQDVTIHPYSAQLYDACTSERGMGVLAFFSKFYMGSTWTTESLKHAINHYGDVFDRVIIITDEQSHSFDALPNLKSRFKYVLNVGSYKPSISTGTWQNITGFSEQIVHYIAADETDTAAW